MNHVNLGSVPVITGRVHAIIGRVPEMIGRVSEIIGRVSAIVVRMSEEIDTEYHIDPNRIHRTCFIDGSYMSNNLKLNNL
jgi:hypothetical protein